MRRSVVSFVRNNEVPLHRHIRNASAVQRRLICKHVNLLATELLATRPFAHRFMEAKRTHYSRAHGSVTPVDRQAKQNCAV